jgi:hypothetical protein
MTTEYESKLMLRMSENDETGRATFQAFPLHFREVFGTYSLESLLTFKVNMEHLLADINAAIAMQTRPRQEQPAPGPDRMLSPDQAARMFGVTRRWLLERADDLPGARRLSKKVIRFSERALSRHLAKGRA